MNTLEDFLDFLFADLKGYVYCPLYDRPSKKMEQQFFLWPEERSVLKDWIEVSSEKGDVYIAPAIFKEPSGEKKHFKASNVVWAEYDGTVPPVFSELPEPDCIIQSSSAAHQHIYWSISGVDTGEDIERVNRGIASSLGADSGWACNKLLRPPFTRNHKYSDSTSTSVVHLRIPTNGAPSSSFPSIRKENATPLKTKELPSYEKILNMREVSTEAIEMLTTAVPVEGARSDFLFKLGAILAEDGLTEKEIVSLLLHADERVGKFKGREDQLSQLADLASKAWHKVNDEVIYSPLDILHYHLDIEWIIQDWLHTRGGLILSAPPGVGKTQLSLELAFCLSTGMPFLDKAAVVPKRVLFVSLEMSVEELKYIFRKQFSKFERGKELWAANMGIWTPVEGETKKIDREIEKFKPDVVIIDSLSELAGDDLKETEGRRIMKWFRKARKRYNCGIILIHHNRKGSEGRKPKKLDDLYGSFWFGKGPDTVIGLWHEDGAEYIEVNSLKVRFGKRLDLKIKRDDDSLTFVVKGSENDNQPGESTPTNKGPDGKFDRSFD